METDRRPRVRSDGNRLYRFIRRLVRVTEAGDKAGEEEEEEKEKGNEMRRRRSRKRWRR